MSAKTNCSAEPHAEQQSLEFQSQILPLYLKDRKAWLRRERALLAPTKPRRISPASDIDCLLEQEQPSREPSPPPITPKKASAQRSMLQKSSAADVLETGR